MTTPVQITTHVADAKARLMTQYIDKPLFTGALAAFTSQMQAVEDMLSGIQATNDPAHAFGVQLDRFGAIVGLARIPGQSDGTYLRLILVEIGINVSQATPETVIAAFAIFTGATHVDFREVYPAGVGLMGNGSALDPAAVDAILLITKSILAAGVSIEYFGYFDPVNPFVFDGGTGGGFGDASDPTVGGNLAGLYVP